MKIKKLLALIVAVIMLLATFITPLMAGAVTFNENELKIKPGTTHATDPEYSLAWIDKLIIRDDATAITASKVIPKPDYPYDVTFEQFIAEVNEYTLLNELNEDSLGESFELAIKTLYYIVVAMGMTADFDEMYSYLSSKGIRMPGEMTATQKMELTVIYAAVKYDAVYVLYDKKVSFTKGTTLDEASAIILSELGGFSIPSSVKSISGLSLYFMKDYIEENGNIPLSDNPDTDELFYWIRAISASKQGYKIPLYMYDETTQAQRDYVDYAYYATIFDTLYEINLNPLALAVADSEGDTYAIPRLILTTMLDESGVSYDKDAATEKLFALACENGWFEIDQEFYSDIYNYEMYVPRDREKLWFTAFSLADQIGGDVKYVSIDLAGKKVASATTNAVKLDPSKNTETVKMEVTYDDEFKKAESVTYTFKVIKTESEKAQEDDLLAKVGEAINAAVPSDSEKAHKVLDGVLEQVDGIVSSAVSQAVEITSPEVVGKDIITTFAIDQTTDSNENAGSEDLFGLGYLSDLVDATYTSGGETETFYTDGIVSENTSIVTKAVEAIRQNPEYVAAPTSFMTIAGLAGFLFIRKRKATDTVSEEDINDQI